MNTEQTPVKESLTTENTTFDLEWAKIGAPVVFMGKYGNKLVTYYNVIIPQPSDMEPSYPFIDLTIEFNSVSTSLLRLSPADLRMAARPECESAGVEYIEKPVSAEELAELRKDSERLWLLTELEDSVFDRIMSESESLEDLREALDGELLAMRGGA